MDEKEYNSPHINQRVIEFRGKILNAMVFVEFMLNAYISRHYCADEDKAQEMIVTILGDDRISLSSKIQAFYAIATKNDQDWYNSYVSTRQPTSKKGTSPSLNNDLMFVVEERNVFAHRLLALSEVFPDNPKGEDVVRFIKFKNDMTPLDYDMKKFNELYSLIMNIGKHFTKKQYYEQ